MIEKTTAPPQPEKANDAHAEKLSFKFPKPRFISTPRDIKSPNLEKKRTLTPSAIMVPKGTTNVALNKPVTTSSDDPIIGELAMVTDGNKEGGDGSYVELHPGRQWVQIDLGAQHDLEGILVWHFNNRATVYFDVIIQVASDPDCVFATTVFNNDHNNSSGMGVGKDKEYIQTNMGRYFKTEGIRGRYIRLWSNGNIDNVLNHYTEVEVYGRPAPLGVPAGTEIKKLVIDLPEPIIIGEWWGGPPKSPNLEKETTRPPKYIIVPKETTNVALRKPVTSSEKEDPIIGILNQVNDGVKKGNDGYFVELGPGPQWVQIDLGSPHDLEGIMVWRSIGHRRIYSDAIVQTSLSPDCSNATTIFNNDHDNSSKQGFGKDKEYIDGYEGRYFKAHGVRGRYVRIWSNGNSANELNHYNEIEIYGYPAKSQQEEKEELKLKFPTRRFVFLPAVPKVIEKATAPAQPTKTSDAETEVLTFELPKQRMHWDMVGNLKSENLEEKPTQNPKSIVVPKGTTNVALGKSVKVCPCDPDPEKYKPIIGEFSMITDGDKTAYDGTYVELAEGCKWIQIDLGSIHDLEAIMLWQSPGHFPTIYHDIIIQASWDPDFISTTTIFNNDHDNSSKQGIGKDKEFIQRHEGRYFNAKKTRTRYIRIWSNGNNRSESNLFVEVEAYGRPTNNAETEVLTFDIPRQAFTYCPIGIPESDNLEERPTLNPKSIVVPKGTTNVALGKPVTVCPCDPYPEKYKPIVGEFAMVTDGDKTATEGSYVELAKGCKWIQIDLGSVHELEAIMLWQSPNHQRRIYHDLIIQASCDPDFIYATTIFNNDHDNSSRQGVGKDKEFIQRHEGRYFDARKEKHNYSRQLFNGESTLHPHFDAKNAKARYVRIWSNGNDRNEYNQFVEVEVFAPPSALTRAAGKDLEELIIELPRYTIIGEHWHGPPKSPNLEKTETPPPASILVPKGTVNVALNKPVTSSDPEPIIGYAEIVNDGSKEGRDGDFVEFGPGPQWIQIDLGAPHDLEAIMMWRAIGHLRIYFDTIIQACSEPDFSNPTTIFNNDHDNSAGQGAGTDKDYVDTYKGRFFNTQGVRARYVRFWSNGNTANELNHYNEIEIYGRPAKNIASARSEKIDLALPKAQFYFRPAEAKAITQTTPPPKPEKASNATKEKLTFQFPKFKELGTPKNIRCPNLEKKQLKTPRMILVPKGTRNLALKKEVTSSDEEPVVGDLTLVTDGEKEADDGYYVELGPGPQWVQIDLGEPCEIAALLLWHFHQSARAYRDIVIRTADDPDFITNVQTLANNDHDNSSGLGVGRDKEYLESCMGRLTTLKTPVRARYVRLYSNGNTENELNHYTEVEIYGRPAHEIEK